MKSGRGRRSAVSPQTMRRMSADVWVLVCSHMQSSPHAVFRLMTACKAVRAELLHHRGEWWDMFYSKVLAYQRGLPHSNYRHSLISLGASSMFEGHKQRLLRLIFARQCHLCGKRFKHRIVPALNIRACPACLRQNLVSNIVLHSRYGIDFSSDPHLRALVVEQGRVLVFHARHLSRGKLLLLTEDPCDLAHMQGPINFWGVICFFLRQDLPSSSLLQQAESGQQQRRLAAQFLTARLMRQQQAGGLMRRMVLERNERQRRVLHPALPSPYWVPGGAFYCQMAPRRHDGITEQADIARLKQGLEAAARQTRRHHEHLLA